MGVLHWEKPKQKMPTEQWKKISADSAPPGVYTPNMSEEDKRKIKAKFIPGTRSGYPQVEIRLSRSAEILIIVSPNGFEMKSDRDSRRHMKVKMSMNGPAYMSFEDINYIQQAVKEAREAIEEFVKNGTRPDR